MILTEEMIKKLPVLTEEQERDAEFVEANFEEDLKEMLEQAQEEEPKEEVKLNKKELRRLTEVLKDAEQLNLGNMMYLPSDYQELKWFWDFVAEKNNAMLVLKKQ